MTTYTVRVRLEVGAEIEVGAESREEAERIACSDSDRILNASDREVEINEATVIMEDGRDV